MTVAREPFICTLKAGDNRVHPPSLDDIAAVELSLYDFRLLPPSIEPLRLAAMTPDHFDQVHWAGEHLLVRGRPVHFTRRRHHGTLSVSPTPDADYWLRVTYRAPIKTETRDPLGQP